MRLTVSQVFGVSKDMVLSYIERDQVDAKFKEALEGDKHIIVYGSSKQGKSALRRKHLSEEKEILIQCGPQHNTADIYASILRQFEILLETSSSEKTIKAGEANAGIKVKVKVPFLGEGDGSLGIKGSDAVEKVINYKSIDINLELAQDIGEVIHITKRDKVIVLENFHYLSDEVQRKLAFDLRSFQEIGIRFIILGIWRERNRLNQFNGDLVDRIVEIPVEPWEDKDFDQVINKGVNQLNIRFSDEVKRRIIEVSFGNIGIVQEICKQFCISSKVIGKTENCLILEDIEILEEAIGIKVESYTSRHLRALESIADASRLYERGLFLPYYIVKVILETDIEDLKQGIQRQELHSKIKDVHYRSEDVRPGDMTNLLHGLGVLQNKKSVVPPLFDYDITNRRLRIIDSTLFFFLKFTDKQIILDEIPNPTEYL
ncbi:MULTISPECIES: hypothetical protein [Exiguobacterium]|uniref:hypothetical protein n=1 Tax=Exiguobacterium TaxID=33986 RepID=UPI001BE9F916|nr:MULTISPECIES: hypothetical protein [Exiguobacterium]MCT4776680.1 hypothetical protein [Exiguobacterium aquaticum]MCT4788713.1 hypothetical protein [Exiguobacterium mexicanum]